jgi:hypothetical protein
MDTSFNKSKKSEVGTQVILRRIGPSESARTLFESAGLIDGLCTFVKGGLTAGDTAIVIAVGSHLSAMENQLREQGVQIFSMRVYDQYIPLNAEAVLDQFMLKGWPDETLFRHLVMTLASRAIKKGKNVRVFSELSALLWFRGYPKAAAELETIWKNVLTDATDYADVELTTETVTEPRSPSSET